MNKMQYVSTRGGGEPRNFRDVLIQGLAPDGGLYVPRRYPKLNPEHLRGATYREVAEAVFRLFATDIPEGVLSGIIRETYTAEIFGRGDIVPIRWLEHDIGLLSLSGGPSGAFKDIALQVVARLIDDELERRNERSAVVVATSGDTGGAAIRAFANMKRTDLFVLWPQGRVSYIQRKQMTVGLAPNVHSLAIDGTFDDCQLLVKGLFGDPSFAAWYNLSGVNSINWARIVAQVVYWVFCHLKATTRPKQPLTVSVPSGNFGNAFSAFVARKILRVPMQIVVATNMNDVLHRFFAEGIYGGKTEVVPTSSPSMDILGASNLERLVFELSGRNPEITRLFYHILAEVGEVHSPHLHPGRALRILSGTASEEDVLRAIHAVRQRYDYLMDPHTAVAWSVGTSLLEKHALATPLIVAETALPFKFPDTIERATGVRPELPPQFAYLTEGSERFTPLPFDLEEVKKYIAAHAR